MNISTLIARRYLFAKKSRNVINLISFISFFGLLVSSAALIIILSGFNGIQQYVEQMYGRHSADIYIQPILGKSIKDNHPIFDTIKNINNVKYFSKIIEETALLKFEDKWTSAIIKGIDSSVFSAEKWSESIIDGDQALYFRGYPTIILGYGIQNQLQSPIDLNFLNEVKVFTLSKNKKLSVQNKGSLRNKNLIFGGVFSINPELDQTYAIVDYNIANDIFEMNNSAHSIELFLDDRSELNNIKNRLIKFDKEFKIRSHEEKNQLIYAANDAEKWMVLAVLIFILILSSFTVIASITMLIIDKKKDIRTLTALGCKYSSIKNIFFKEGLFISLLGSTSGLLIGVLVCWLQIHFELIKLKDAAISYWPVKVELIDIVMLMIILLSCGVIAAYLPSKILMKKLITF